MSSQLEALPLRHVLTLPAMGSAVRIARETTEQVLREWGISRRHPTVDPALLILSELVTNSVQHAASMSPNVTVIRPDRPDRPDRSDRSDRPARLVGGRSDGRRPGRLPARRRGTAPGTRGDPADGSLVSDGTRPPIPVHCDPTAALTAHRAAVGK
ncbi:ATP-binding protein [Streptomyces scopuliridis]